MAGLAHFSEQVDYGFMVSTLVLLGVLLLSSNTAVGQVVYKCIGQDGKPEFTDRQCASTLGKAGDRKGLNKDPASVQPYAPEKKSTAHPPSIRNQSRPSSAREPTSLEEYLSMLKNEWRQACVRGDKKACVSVECLDFPPTKKCLDARGMPYGVDWFVDGEVRNPDGNPIYKITCTSGNPWQPKTAHLRCNVDQGSCELSGGASNGQAKSYRSLDAAGRDICKVYHWDVSIIARRKAMCAQGGTLDCKVVHLMELGNYPKEVENFEKQSECGRGDRQYCYFDDCRKDARSQRCLEGKRYAQGDGWIATNRFHDAQDRSRVSIRCLAKNQELIDPKIAIRCESGIKNCRREVDVETLIGKESSLNDVAKRICSDTFALTFPKKIPELSTNRISQ